MTSTAPDRREIIATIVGTETMTELDAAWAAFSRLPHPRVTVYGPYDAGKTTLIKRLLTEAGTPVPDWLIVSGRPETFTVTEVESAGVGYLDTPGTAGHSAEHNRLADEALTLTDALLVVLPQQRLHEDTGRLIELANAGFPPNALLVAIAQSDTVGTDPQSDPDGFRQLCDHRRDELLKTLPEHLAQTLAGAVHVIAADPYGEVGGASQPELSHYDPYRVWDGITELRTQLSSLTGRLPELRDAARRRFWERATASARAEGEHELAQLSALLQEAGQRRQRQAVLEHELTTIDHAAVGELRKAIGEELHAVMRVADGMDAESVRSATAERLQQRLRAWQLEYGAKLKALASEAELELAVQNVDPDSVQYDQWLRELLMTEPQVPAAGSTPSLFGEMSTPATTAVKGAIRLHLGVPLDEAREQLKFLSYLKSRAVVSFGEETAKLDPNADDYEKLRKALAWESRKPVVEFLAGDSVFATLDEADRAKKWISRMDIAADFVPAALSLAGLLAEQVSGHRAARREQQQRTEERKRINRAAEAFMAEILGDGDDPAEGTWNNAVTALRKRLHADPLLEPVIVAATERKEALESACTGLL
jgi:50S ribosome-binding GTPase